MERIQHCRLCKCKDLVTVLELGDQVLTGVFPSSTENSISKGPLTMIWCSECNLLQLGHRYDPNEMYGENYGYRSGLNQMMVEHLTTKINGLTRQYPIQKDDAVLDIGSNDATLLKSYRDKSIRKIGIDPTGIKFKEYYTEDMELIPDFFNAQNIHQIDLNLKFKIITSISMFYDLEDPLSFVKDITQVLAEDGVWHFEQSYMPSMLRLNSYDTICHEHVEYYSLKPVKLLLEKCGLKILDVKMNSVNGGSFAVTAAHKDSIYKENSAVIEWLLEQEQTMGLHTPLPFRQFEQRVFEHRDNLRKLISYLHKEGKTIHAYGASTKGNVVLQFCKFNYGEISHVAEINEDKFGKFTPGSHIPIVSDKESKSMQPDYYLVLPWHFKAGILNNEKEYLRDGGSLIFPFPEIEII
jgi:hypothetical protein